MTEMNHHTVVRRELEDFTYNFGWNTVSCDENLCIEIVSVADFPSEFGQFKIVGFINNREGEEDHCAVIKGQLGDGENVLCRVHSECLTGDALGSRRCDCGPQLRLALRTIEAEGRGIVLYMRQEGRGIGLTNKLRAYALQDQGLDTFDANTELGFQPEERDFEVAAAMLQALGVKSVKLMTNNPEKISQLEKYGVPVAERVQHELPPHKDDLYYLETKKKRFGHELKLVKRDK